MGPFGGRPENPRDGAGNRPNNLTARKRGKGCSPGDQAAIASLRADARESQVAMRGLGFLSPRECRRALTTGARLPYHESPRREPGRASGAAAGRHLNNRRVVGRQRSRTIAEDGMSSAIPMESLILAQDKRWRRA
jgi:hypothetical protein